MADTIRSIATRRGLLTWARPTKTTRIAGLGIPAQKQILVLGAEKGRPACPLPGKPSG
jgi:hypothetical protein